MEGQVLDARHLHKSNYRKTGPSFAQTVVAHFYGVSLEDIHAATRRGVQAAFARQVAMYLVHVVYGLSLTEVAQAFGRDRTTASHACHRVEDMRDDPALDRQLAQLERLLREACAIEVMS